MYVAPRRALRLIKRFHEGFDGSYTGDLMHLKQLPCPHSERDVSLARLSCKSFVTDARVQASV